MKILFDYILGKYPWFIRWTFYSMIGMMTVLGGAFSLGWQAAPLAEAYIDDRVDRWTAPKFEILKMSIDNVDDKATDMNRKIDILIAR